MNSLVAYHSDQNEPAADISGGVILIVYGIREGCGHLRLGT
jgi:hypothetical protein